jgi:hypothetical protein
MLRLKLMYGMVETGNFGKRKSNKPISQESQEIKRINLKELQG